MTPSRKSAFFGFLAILAVAAVLFVPGPDDERGTGKNAAPAQGFKGATPSSTIAQSAAERVTNRTDGRMRFADLEADRLRVLLEAFDGAARRVRFATGAPDFLDPKTSPFLQAPDGRVIQLELFDDLMVPIVLTDTGVSRSGVQLIEGVVPGYPDSRFLMSASGGEASLSIEISPDDRYVVNALDDGVYEIVELDPTMVPPCAGPINIFIDADVLAARAVDEEETSSRHRMARAANPSAHALIDLLVIYTADVASSYSSLAIRNKTELAVAEANSDFERSGARVRLRLVGVEENEYVENGSNSDALERLRRTTDGYLDDVHELRDELGADLVCLLQEEKDTSSSGIAYVMTKTGDRFSENFGFSVVEYEYLTGLNTMVHEIGHNLGCNHDRENAGNETLYPFSYGYRFTARSGTTYRTIMAYRPGSRISYFSTPLKTFGAFNDPVGIAPDLPQESDNVESLNRASFEVSNYRLAEEGLDPEARLVNVSTRATVGAGEKALIGGFVIGASEEKTILVRALGPSLAGYGVGDNLPALKVTLYRDDEVLATNQGWRLGPDTQAVIDTGYAPDFDSEPIILITVGPGAYTAVVESADARTGVALVEVYEIGDGESRLVNLSTRGYVGIGEEVMIGGFVIGGDVGGTKRVLIRALGPSLAGFGVADAMFDPAMRLYDESGTVLLENDDWDYGNQQDVIAALGFAPDIRRESAMILDLIPGLYTVVVRPYENDDGQKPGVGLVEAYEIEVD